jgi:hypothetical protein
MKYLTSLFLLALPSLVLGQDIEWPETKYRVGDCITPVDPLWAWFGEPALVTDIVYSQRYESFLYHLRIKEALNWVSNIDYVSAVDRYTAKLSSCPP